ncbi:MAG: PspC domain-containing protein [Gaiellaceae bacterium]
MSQAGEAGTSTPSTGAGESVKRLRRSREDRVFAGVCGGLADYFGLHHTIYRVAFIALAFVGGAGILLYIAAALVIPDEGAEDSVLAGALREHRERPWLIIGVALLALSGLIFLSSPHVYLWWGSDFWLVALVLGIVIVLWQLSARREEWTGSGTAAAAPAATGVSSEADATSSETAVISPPVRPPRPRPSLFWPGAGLLLAAGGLLGLLQSLDALDVNWSAALAGGVILIGVLMAVAGWHAHTAGLAFLGLVLLLAMALALSASGVVRGGIGDRLEQPTVAADLGARYRLGIGDLRLDLSRLVLRPGERHVKASVGIGKLLVTVPPNVAVSVNGRAGIGNTDLYGRARGGTHVSQSSTDAGFDGSARRLVLDLHVSVGDLVVRR